MFFFLLWRFCKLFLELLTFSCGFFVRTIIAALSSKQCVCLVISKVRSKELLDTILPLSKTLWRIRDKCLKSLIFTDLRVLDWFQSIKVSVNSTGIKDNKACFVGRAVYLGPQVVLYLTGMKSGARYVHTHYPGLILTKSRSQSESQHGL